MKERAALQKLHELFDGRGLALLAISMDRKGRSVVEPYKKRNRLTFPHLLDVGRRATEAYGVRYTPMTFIVDKRGRVVARVIGPRPWADPEFQRLFEEMIAEERVEADGGETLPPSSPSKAPISMGRYILLKSKRLWDQLRRQVWP